MKLLNKVTPYSIKRAVLVFGMAAATLLGGCKKDDPAPTPTKDIDIVFNQNNVAPISVEAVRSILDSKEAPTIRTIYLVPEEGTWNNCGTNTIKGIRKYCEPVFALSPKVRGKGDFNFARGQAASIPNDSLWFIDHGWTINKRFLENKQAQK